MNIRLRNSWSYIGEINGQHRWEWRVFVDDDGSGDIDAIDSVEYILHPSFKNPKRVIEDRHDNFALNTSGWGTFMLKAFALTKQGSRIPLHHYVMLKFEPKNGTTE